MRLFSLPNRDKIISELTRRYEEVLRKAEKGIHNDEEAQQFISLLAHYIYHLKKTDLTRYAIEKLFYQREVIAGDKVLVDEADKIIAQMKVDRVRLIEYAKEKSIKLDAYQFREGVQRITGDMEFSFYLQLLTQFLDRPSDEQHVSELPRAIGNLRSMSFAVQQYGGETPELKSMKASYGKLQDEFARKLKLQGVRLDYLRIEDYKVLEGIWRGVYQENNHDDDLMFHLEYGDLFEKNSHYDQRQQAKADEFISKHVTHLQRLHNYLIDGLEDASAREKLLRWTVEHFGPTFISLTLIILVWIALHWAGIDINFDDIKNKAGL